MTAALQAGRRRRTSRTAIGLIVASLVLLLLAANAHLVYVAVTSQPDCVAHLKQGDAGPSGTFRAAKSACSPGARS
jgi:hypothetical protein